MAKGTHVHTKVKIVFRYAVPVLFILVRKFSLDSFQIWRNFIFIWRRHPPLAEANEKNYFPSPIPKTKQHMPPADRGGGGSGMAQ